MVSLKDLSLRFGFHFNKAKLKNYNRDFLINSASN